MAYVTCSLYHQRVPETDVSNEPPITTEDVQREPPSRDTSKSSATRLRARAKSATSPLALQEPQESQRPAGLSKAQLGKLPRRQPVEVAEQEQEGEQHLAELVLTINHSLGRARSKTKMKRRRRWMIWI